MIFLYVICGLLLFLFLAWLFLIAPSGRVRKTKEFFRRCRFFAHRGLHGDGIPENSLAAFERACRAGYGIELDVHLTSDGELVVFHDDTLNRMCGVEGTVEKMTLPELKACRLAGTEEQIPTFAEVLSLVAGRSTLLVEVKGESRDTEVCRKTAEMLDSYEGRYCMESFNPFYVRWFRLNRPQTVRGMLSCKMPGNEFTHSVIKNFLLSNMLLNVIARPDFLAYGIDSRSMPSFRMARLLGGYPVAWTARTQEDLGHAKKIFSCIIFEQLRLGRAPAREKEKDNV